MAQTTPPPPVMVPRHLVFTFCSQPRGTHGKNYNIREILGLDVLDYRLLILDLTELATTSGLSMGRSFRMQNMAQLSEVRERALELYPGLGIFESSKWPCDALLAIVLKSSSERRSWALYQARRAELQAERERAALWAKLLVSSLSRVVPPPVFPVIFDLTTLPNGIAGCLIEELLGIPLVLWPLVSLATLSLLSVRPRSPLTLIHGPRFTHLLPLGNTQPQIMTVKVAPPNCPFLTRKHWILRMTIRVAVDGEVMVAGKVGAIGTRLSVVQAIPLQCELVDKFAGGGLTNLDPPIRLPPPTKSHPSSSYPYHHASNPSHSRLVSAPQASSSQAPCPHGLGPNSPALDLFGPVPAPHSTNPLPVAPEAYLYSRKGSISRPFQSQLPLANAYRAAKLADEQRKLNARKHQRGQSQTHNPSQRSDREQRGERERAKSEGRALDAKDTRERIEKDRACSAMSESTVAVAWTTYEKACSELMDAKPTKGKPLSSNLTFYDTPWPVLGTASTFHDLTTQNIAAFLLSPHHSQGKSRRARLRAAILIWHPDPFAQKVLPRVAESNRPAVITAVDTVARIVTVLISADDS
ncbi:hypothetical protein FRC08_006800 [Ceratobasidium sp. 394]|nr:hypothetical protein FRC08_006800 [Ceratobasidium sp. 394]